MNDEVQRELPNHLPRLWRFALRLAREPHDAEDLVQRTCVRALERRAQWQAGTALLSWLFAIEHSIWLNELRTPQRRRTASLEAEVPWSELMAEPTGAGNPELRLHYTQVVRAVESLPEAQRVVMLLVAVEGMSYREAADILALPIGTVMSRLSRARIAVGQKFLERPSGRETDKERHHGR